MKRSWFGFLLLVVLLIIALAVTWVMGEIHRPISRDLRQAADAALSDNWAEAAAAVRQARNQWQRWTNVRLCFADHTPTEDIDSLFGSLEAYEAGKEATDFAAACLQLMEKVDAVGQAHGLSLGNLL